MLTAIFCLFFSTAVFSQAITTDVNAELSLVDGKTIFRMGEPIRLSLIFTARNAEYNLLISSEQMVNLPDEMILSPSERAFSWRAQYERGKYFMNDYFGYAKISEKPINIDLVLNDFFRFDKPGKYSVYVKTKRVLAAGDKSRFDGKLIPLITNAVEFEVKGMSETEEREEVKRLGALIDSKNDIGEQNEFIRNLSFLTGDASTVEKVGRFLKPDEYKGNYHHIIRTGILMARNKLLAIKLLEEALRDPNREVNFDLPQLLAELRWLQESDNFQPNDENDKRKLIERRSKRTTEISQTYFNELLESLPNRTAKSRLVTAYTVFIQLPKEDVSSAAYHTTKSILLENFDELTPYGKDQLLGYFWEKIKTPTLLSSIEKILAGGEPVSYWSYRNLALKRLVEFDQKKARSIVIDEIRKPDSRISFEVLSSLNDNFLPETDAALLEQIRKLASSKDFQLNQKILLAARYSTGGIYPELLEIYKAYGNDWSAESKDLMLGYFIRHNENEAIPLIEKRLSESDDKGGFNIFITLPE